MFLLTATPASHFDSFNQRNPLTSTMAELISERELGNYLKDFQPGISTTCTNLLLQILYTILLLDMWQFIPITRCS